MRAKMIMNDPTDEVEVHLTGRETIVAAADEESGSACVSLRGSFGGPAAVIYCDDHAYAARLAAAINGARGSAPEALGAAASRALEAEAAR